MMVHHLLYYTAGRVDRGPGGCLGGAFLSGRGEEHPDGQFDTLSPPAMRARYGVRNATPTAPRRVVADRDGHEPLQARQALLRAHEALVHDRAAHAGLPDDGRRLPHLRNGHGLRRAGRRERGSTFTDRSSWTVPFNAPHPRGASHHHGGATHQTLVSTTCDRTLLDASAYYGAARPPVQHDPPDPARAGADRQRHVRDARKASRCRRRGARAHRGPPQLDAARGGDGLLGRCCSRATTRVTALRAAAQRPARGHEPARYDRTAPFVYDREVPQLLQPTGALEARSPAPWCRSATSTSGPRS